MRSAEGTVCSRKIESVSIPARTTPHDAREQPQRVQHIIRRPNIELLNLKLPRSTFFV